MISRSCFIGSLFLCRRLASTKTRTEPQTISQRKTRASLVSRLFEPIAGCAKKDTATRSSHANPLYSASTARQTAKEAGTAAKVEVLERRLLFPQPSFRVVRRMVPAASLFWVEPGRLQQREEGGGETRHRCLHARLPACRRALLLRVPEVGTQRRG